MQELPTDEAVIAWGDLGIPEMNTQLWASNNSFVVAMYYRVAFQVSMANEFLRQTTEAKLAERNVSPELAADIQIFRAEARFLRALSYWHGIDIFGNIPLVTEEDPIGPTAPLQSTRQEIFDFLVSELTAIQADLPATAGQGTYGRATKEAAAMLLAKLYLNAGVYTGTPQYAQALAAAQQVIAGPFTLDPSYRHLFQADNHTSPEIIFPVIQDGKLTQSYGGTTFLIHASCGGTMAPGDQGVNGMLVRPAPQAGGVRPFPDPGRPAGVVLLDRRPDRGRRQHQHFHQRRGGPKVHEQDKCRNQRLRPRVSRHRLPDVPAG